MPQQSDERYPSYKKHETWSMVSRVTDEQEDKWRKQMAGNWSIVVPWTHHGAMRNEGNRVVLPLSVWPSALGYIYPLYTVCQDIITVANHSYILLKDLFSNVEGRLEDLSHEPFHPFFNEKGKRWLLQARSSVSAITILNLIWWRLFCWQNISLSAAELDTG